MVDAKVWEESSDLVHEILAAQEEMPEEADPQSAKFAVHKGHLGTILGNKEHLTCVWTQGKVEEVGMWTM